MTRSSASSVAALAAAAALLAAGLGPATDAHPEPAPLVGSDHGTDDAGFWNVKKGMATKTGYRLVFAWDADAPVAGYAEWGFSSDDLDQVARPPSDGLDTAGLAVADIMPEQVGTTIHYRIVDNVTGQATEVDSFEATNGWTTSASDGAHEIDLLVQVDSEALPPEVPSDQGLREIAFGTDVAAERVWDGTDEHVRVDDVIVTDTALNYPANQPFGPGICAENSQRVNGWQVQHTLADVLVETSVPLDSHTYPKAMEDPCTAIYMGRLGQIVVNWGGVGGTAFLHFGHVLAHELGHYAMDLPDLYTLEPDAKPDCWAGTSGTPGEDDNWDISMMHNDFGWDGSRWRGSEIDRNRTVTPCEYGNAAPSWPTLASLYPAVPTLESLKENGSAKPVHSDSDHQVAVGNPDSPSGSDGWDGLILDEEPVGSRLYHAPDAASTTSGTGPTDLPHSFPAADTVLP